MNTISPARRPTVAGFARRGGILLLAAGLAACGAAEDHLAKATTIDVAGHPLSFTADGVAIEVGGRRAQVTAGGELRIDGAPVPVPEALRPTLVEYHRAAFAVREQSVATGLAGLQVGKDAVAEVVSGLVSGEPERIGERVEAKAGKVVAAAGGLCTSLEGLQRAQDVLAAGLAAFAPFAALGAADVSKCREGLAVAQRELAAGAGAVAAVAAPDAPAAPADPAPAPASEPAPVPGPAAAPTASPAAAGP